jgi:hypothetical protein
MRKEKVEISTIKLNQIEKDPAYLLGTSTANTEMHKNILASYGNLTPIIVAPTENNSMQRLLKGANICIAAENLGVKELNTIIYNEQDKIKQLLLMLKLSELNDDIGEITKGAFIMALHNDHSYSLAELSSELKKSKSWLSKRMSLKKNLTAEVQEQVEKGELCPRTAEEITRLPVEVQVQFVSHVLENSMSKNLVAKLVKLYNDPASKDELKEKILKSPLEVNFVDTIKISKSDQLKYDHLEDLIKNTTLSINHLISVVKKYNLENLLNVKRELKNLNTIILQLSNIIKNIFDVND